MKNQITITIAGTTKSGKSRIAYIVKEVLKIHGLRVEFDPTPDYPDERMFNRIMRENLDDALANVSKDTMVVVKEVQVSREHYELESRKVTKG